MSVFVVRAFVKLRAVLATHKELAGKLSELEHRVGTIIRIDPWHQPYEYEGGGTNLVLRSPGPDGKANTCDDVTETH